jgi:pimeloyl-ACP methyl ester carboxylesterase
MVFMRHRAPPAYHSMPGSRRTLDPEARVPDSERNPWEETPLPTFRNGDVELYYEEQGTGFPILLIAPGGMKSTISFWEAAMPWNLVEQLSAEHRVITMDQRNAGQSSAPVSVTDGWQTYTNDQLALLDHLGIDRFHVAGMCIGGPYCLSLIRTAPERVASAILFQTIGLTDNRQAFYTMFDAWAEELKAAGKAAPEEAWSAFRKAMYGGDDLLFSVDEEFVSKCQTPLLVLMGNDEYHPQEASRRVAALAPNATFIEHWKQEPHIPAARKAVGTFLSGKS